MKDWETILSGLIGKPFVINARGPEAYDCWGIVTHVLKELGIEIPMDWCAPDDPSKKEEYWAYTMTEIEKQTHENSWTRTDTPVYGNVVAMSRNRIMSHVGILTPFGILHATEKFGVVLSTEKELRDVGYRRIEYYSWAK